MKHVLNLVKLKFMNRLLHITFLFDLFSFGKILESLDFCDISFQDKVMTRLCRI